MDTSLRSPTSRRRRASDHFGVVAATAGKDTWKTWAGRTDGDDEFQPMDLVRGMKRKFNKRFVWTMPKAGTPCPICLCEPTTEAVGSTASDFFTLNAANDDTTSHGEENEELWFMMSSCGHTVCYDCLRAYAENQVKDPEHVGPLKCPVCSLPLREKDAIAALQHDSSLIDYWDQKIRDQLLRALPNYRQCPHCCNNDDDNNEKKKDNNAASSSYERSMSGGTSSSSSATTKGGGGFVTSECLSPIYEEREQDALWWLQQIANVRLFCLVLYLLFVSLYFQKSQPLSSSSGDNNVASELFVNILNVILLPMGILYQTNIYATCQAFFARLAKRALFKPIIVECPCCDKPFILNAEAELSTSSGAVINDKATQEWLGNHTRPCPSCSVPISKIDGCNHMRCTHCKASFCWACMRLRTSCAAYKCNNGAPYGNATFIGDGNDNNNAMETNNNNLYEGTIIDRINRLENHNTMTSNNNNGNDNYTKDLLVSLLFFAGFIILRDTQFVRTTATVAVTAFAGVFSILFSSASLLLLVLVMAAMKNQRHRQEQRYRNRQNNYQPQQPQQQQQYHEDHQPQRRRSSLLQRLIPNNNNNSNRNLNVDNMTEGEMIAEAIARSLQEH